jgi:hypothetical protein
LAGIEPEGNRPEHGSFAVGLRDLDRLQHSWQFMHGRILYLTGAEVELECCCRSLRQQTNMQQCIYLM